MMPTDATRVGWRLLLYPEAGEAGGSFRGKSAEGRGGFFEFDSDRSGSEAARRARAKVRRYCAANGLNRLGTLTYAGEGCWDPVQFRADLRPFFRRLRSEVDEPLPYLWVPEWHPGGHGLHGHFAVPRFIRKSLIDEAWPHGFTHIKRLQGPPVGSGVRGEARMAARYLSKYLSKEMGRAGGLNRYDLAQGFQPRSVELWARSEAEVVALAVEEMGSAPAYVWRSATQEGWRGPSAVSLRWL